jgi:hypothetical protein
VEHRGKTESKIPDVCVFSIAFGKEVFLKPYRAMFDLPEYQIH